MKTATVTTEQAIARGLRQSAHGPTFREGTCKIQVEALFSVPSAGNPDASSGWANGTTIKHKAPTDPAALADFIAHAPRGMIAWWTGGSHGHGHVAPVYGHGMILTSDLGGVGRFHVQPLDRVRRDWGLRFVGLSEDLEGVRVYKAPPSHPLVSAVIDAHPGPARYAAMQRLAQHGTPKGRKHAQAWLRAENQKRTSLGHIHSMILPVR